MKERNQHWLMETKLKVSRVVKNINRPVNFNPIISSKVLINSLQPWFGLQHQDFLIICDHNWDHIGCICPWYQQTQLQLIFKTLISNDLRFHSKNPCQKKESLFHVLYVSESDKI